MNHADVQLRFGPFILQPARKLLLERNEVVSIGSRALALLIALTERPGELLHRDELVALVWPKSLVEETSLRVHMSALRRVLGDNQTVARYIINKPGLGYQFVAPIERLTSGPVRQSQTDEARVCNNLPTRLTKILGRAEEIAALERRLRTGRLVTVTGPGGMGKTTIAIAAAKNASASFSDGTCFIDLGPINEPHLLLAAVTAALGLDALEMVETSMSALSFALSSKQLLLILDNCEHVIDAAVAFAEQILAKAPQVVILATSREPLCAEGEHVYQVAALALPREGEDALIEDEALSPAVQLFVERAAANTSTFQLTPKNYYDVASLCRQLDGIPLAIELAASRVDALGVVALAAGLQDCFRLLTRGKRLALPRHRTLSALMDWSHDLLSTAEQMVFRRLSVFRSGFALEGAVAVAAFVPIHADTVIDCVLSLVSKSLITSDLSGTLMPFRLLYSIRAYASAKLSEQVTEESMAAERHASYVKVLLENSATRMLTVPFFERKALHHQLANDLRAAMSWTVSASGSAMLGVELGVAAVLSAYESGASVDSYGNYLDCALERLAQCADSHPQLELCGLAVLCLVSAQSKALRRSQIDMVSRTLELSERCGTVDDKIAALFGGASAAFGSGRYVEAQRLIQRMRQYFVGSSAKLEVVVADRLSVLVSHYLGDHVHSSKLAETVAACTFEGVPRRFIPEIPLAVSMSIVRARILWLQGFADQAREMADHALRHATMGGVEHEISACQALGFGVVPIALWCGDLGRAVHGLQRLEELAVRVPLSYWLSWAASLGAAIQLHNAGSPVIASTQASLGNPKEADHLGTFNESLVSQLIIDRVAAGEVGWCAPEILRVQGERRLLQSDAQALSDGEAIFKQSLILANEQGALAWTLRASTSLARLWWTQGMTAEARQLLQTTLAQFAEGFDTADQINAAAMLAAMHAELLPEKYIDEAGVLIAT